MGDKRRRIANRTERLTEEEFRGLDVGDLVRHVNGDAMAYVVEANYGNHVIAVRVAHMTNPREWVLISKVQREVPR